jgi:hypothetical protein
MITARNSVGDARYASGRARITTSIAPSRDRTIRRHSSFNRRRKRLRATALAWNFGTTRPSLG